MQAFTVYPKGNAKPFSLTCERFELKDDQFVLYGPDDNESGIGFLSFFKVAAIIPDHQDATRSYPNTPIQFHVYLKDRDDAVHVFANAFKIENESQIVFYDQDKDMRANVESEWAITNLYVALSELIAVLPSDGLTRRG